jgi:hypothetical protein
MRHTWVQCARHALHPNPEPNPEPRHDEARWIRSVTPPSNISAVVLVACCTACLRPPVGSGLGQLMLASFQASCKPTRTTHGVNTAGKAVPHGSMTWCKSTSDLKRAWISTMASPATRYPDHVLHGKNICTAQLTPGAAQHTTWYAGCMTLGVAALAVICSVTRSHQATSLERQGRSNAAVSFHASVNTAK